MRFDLQKVSRRAVADDLAWPLSGCVDPLKRADRADLARPQGEQGRKLYTHAPNLPIRKRDSQNFLVQEEANQRLGSGTTEIRV